MTTYQFKTKAETLAFLSGKLKQAHILPVYQLVRKDYLADKNACIKNIQEAFVEPYLIFRSSSKGEDQANDSGAGKYESCLNVCKADVTHIQSSIEKVFASYHSDALDDFILIQPMLTVIKLSGVVFTCDLDTLAPYYTINYDLSNKSDTVTGGYTNTLKTFVIYKQAIHKCANQDLKKLLYTCQEIEELFQNKFLDIEFGINEQGEVYIFQVRPIVKESKLNLSYLDLKEPLHGIYQKVKKLSVERPNLLGDRTVFGVMPDWNPAEIIGIRPKKLAISLYKELVTDSIWAHQRRNYGYRDLRSHPLLVSFLGIPYIDVRVSFNSFIPQDLNEQIAKKLVNHYIDKLIEVPSYHDKVEFEIVHSCYYLNLPEQLKELLQYGFSENEVKRIEFSLLELTNEIIHPEHGLYKKDLQKNKILEQKYENILSSELSLVDKIYWLIEDCKTYGTLPFAGIARAAFIAVQFLRSFVELEIISEEEKNLFMNGLFTISRQMTTDMEGVQQGTYSVQEFLQTYGHIRPGTYDILSKRYDEDFEQYFVQSNVPNYICTKSEIFTFTDDQLQKIDSYLILNGLKVDAKELLQFIKESIEGREYAKFLFTKSLSQAMCLIEEYGYRNGLRKEELAYLDYAKIKELYSTLEHRYVKDIFTADIEKNQVFYQYTQAVKLPSVILKPEDVYGFYLLNEEPNYITLKTVVAEVVAHTDLMHTNLEGKIICIPSADPGYDFLFTKNIAGLITQYGGANSHMAIRCAELGIPAVIGAGEINYKQWSQAQSLEIHALNKKVRVMNPFIKEMV